MAGVASAIGVGSQAVNWNEWVLYDFVKNATGNPKNINTLAYDGRNLLTSAFSTVTQLNPGNANTRADVEIRLQKVSNNPQGDALHNGPGAIASNVDIKSVQVFRNGNLTTPIVNVSAPSTSSNAKSLTVNSPGNTGITVIFVNEDTDATFEKVIIQGLRTGDRFQVEGLEAFDRFIVGNAAPNSNRTFDLGVTGGKYLEAGNTRLGGFTLFDDGPALELGSLNGVSLTTYDSGTNFPATGNTSPKTTTATITLGDLLSGESSATGSDNATIDYSLTLSAPGVDSGLDDMATGNNILLYNDGGNVIEGRVWASDDPVAFRITLTENGNGSIDAGDTLTIDQLRSIKHADGFGQNTASMAADLIILSATITDGDKDPVTDTVNVGNLFVFKDDGPSISMTGMEPTLTVDETVLAENATKNFTANFTSAYGADGSGSLTYGLGVVVGASGLTDTATGEVVNLSLKGGVVEGRTATTDQLVFTVSVAANGDVTLDQQRAVVHADATNPDDATTLSADDLVTLTATITDKDGDSQSATLNIGQNLVFEDDGPSISSNALVKLDDDALPGGNPNGTGDDVDSVNTTGTLGHSFAADGGSIAFLTTGAPSGFSYEAGAGGSLLVKQGTTTVLTLTLNSSSTGAYTVTQNNPIVHAAGLDENNQGFTITYRVTDGDGDTVDGTLSIDVDDDTPTVSSNALVKLDDDALSGGNPNGTGDDDDALNATGTLEHSFGADGAGSIAFLTSGAPEGFSYEAGHEGSLLANQGTTTVLTLTLNSTTGDYTVTQNAPIDHAVGGNENNQAFTINYRVTDGDGDTVDGTLSIDVDDDTPIVRNKTDLIFANSSNPTPGGTGIFAYSIGADSRTSFSSSNSDFSEISLTGTVGTNVITGASVTRDPETASTALFNVQFSYQADPASSALTSATGTLTFDKANGTYTVALTQPLSGFTVLTTSNTQSKQSFNIIGSSASQPEVVVSKLADDFYVRFGAYGAVQGGSTETPLRAGTEPIATTPRDSALNGDPTYSAGEVFQAYWSWASISGDSNGVASDTIQAGEVLDMGFYLNSPGGDLPEPQFPTTRADGIYLKVADLGDGEDLVVILKLISKSNPSDLTTKAVIVDYQDVYLGTETNPYGITFTGPNPGNQGLVIIESNDYNSMLQDYQVYGAQLLVSTEGVSGTGINLNRATGSSGGSTTTQAFAPGGVTADNDVVKIVDIGFIKADSNTLNADLFFKLAVVDADGDATSTQTLNVDIIGSSTFTGTSAAESIQGTGGNDSITGGGGKDILTGGAGVNTFAFTALTDSLLASYDIITDYKAVDKIDAPGSISATLNASIGTVASNFSDIAVVLSSLGTNSAAAFEVSGQSGTFIALNDGMAGFAEGSDAIIHLQNYTIGGGNTVSII